MNDNNPHVSESPEKARLIVAGNIYYQNGQSEHENVVVPLSSIDILDSDEQPFSRLCWVEEKWQKIELGWIKDCSLLVIENRGYQLGNTRPSDEERKAEQQAKIAVASGNIEDPNGLCSICYLPPQRKLILPYPIGFRFFCLRCMSSKVKVKIDLFPL